MRLALGGDVVLARRLGAASGAALAELLGAADLAAANLETVFRTPDAPAAAAAGGLWIGADPGLAGELVRLGLGAVSRANNHAGDYGTQGMATTNAALDAAGVAHSGCGTDLAKARAPAYVTTPSGTVGLVSCATTFPVQAMAGEGNRAIPARPGISMVRVLRTYELDPSRFEQLAGIAEDLGLGPSSTGSFQPSELLARDGRPLAALRPDAGQQVLVLLGDRFVRADRTRTRTHLHPGDAAAVLAAVAEAADHADVAVLSVHAHAGPPPLSVRSPNPAPLPEVAELARRAVSAGAAVVAVHGDHEVGGVEVVDGSAVLYGLGNLVFQPESVAALPADAYAWYELDPEASPADLFRRRFRGGTAGFPARPGPWRGLVATAVFDGAALADLVVHPVSLGIGAPPEERGDPVLARGTEAAAILAEVQRASVPFGTHLVGTADALRVAVRS